MRDIKFRAWDKGVSKFLEHVSGAEMLLFTNYGQSENIILMQYTGLKDKNGKEMYYGDLVRLHYNDKMREDPLCVIIFSPNHCGPYLQFVEYYGNKRLVGYEWDMLQKFWEKPWGTVVGNIYENPELVAV